MAGMMPGVSTGAPHPPPVPQPAHSSADLVDPATKFKMLVPPLKESLKKIMACAAAVFHQNAQFDSTQKVSGHAIQRFDKSLEEFYAICDQIELNLSLALEVLGINADCQRNTPACAPGSGMKFAANSLGPLADLQTYNQYQSVIKTQLACAKEVHDVLLECARKIGVDTSASQPPTS